MDETANIDVTSSAFALRLANLLVATRQQSGQHRVELARSSQGRFVAHDLRAYERGARSLDASVVDELAQLYRCDLGAILPQRVPVSVLPGRVTAAGVSQGFIGEGADAVLVAYLQLVRQLRRQAKSPVVEVRRDDLEVLAGYLEDTSESVLHRLATLMNATQRKRMAMVSVLATGAAVIGLVGAVAAVGTSEPDPVTGNGSDTGVAAVVTDSSVVAPATTPDLAPVTVVVTTDSTVETTVPAPVVTPVVDEVNIPDEVVVMEQADPPVLLESGEPPVPSAP